MLIDVVALILIGAFFIISNNKLSIVNAADRERISDFYISWLGSVTENTIHSVGYVVNMGWLPEKTNEMPEQEPKTTEKEKLQEEWNEWE